MNFSPSSQLFFGDSIHRHPIILKPNCSRVVDPVSQNTVVLPARGTGSEEAKAVPETDTGIGESTEEDSAEKRKRIKRKRIENKILNNGVFVEIFIKERDKSDRPKTNRQKVYQTRFENKNTVDGTE